MERRYGFYLLGIYQSSDVLQCFCGASVNNIQADEADCDFSCTGDSSEVCGGLNRVSIYQDPTFPVADLTTISDYQKLGCYSEGSVGRSLAWRQDQVDATTMTVESCLTACKAGGFSFSGLEFAQECYWYVYIPVTFNMWQTLWSATMLTTQCSRELRLIFNKWCCSGQWDFTVG